MTYPKIIHWNYFETPKCLNIVYVQDEATEKEIKRLGFAEEGYPEIRKMIEKNALNSERAFKELKEVGIDLGA